MNILFVTEYRGNAGNAHAISNFTCVGAELGHNIAFYGPSQPQVVDGLYLPPEMQTARFSTDATVNDPGIPGSPDCQATRCTVSQPAPASTSAPHAASKRLKSAPPAP